MTIDDRLDAILLADEGDKLTAYPDPLTKGAPWTIGIGHTGPEVHPGLVWTQQQVDFAHQLDKATAWQGCYDHFEPWFRALTEARQIVLVCMVYQMGIGRVLEFAHTLAAVRTGDYAAAAAGMKDSAWGRQTPLRVDRLAAMMETGQ